MAVLDQQVEKRLVVVGATLAESSIVSAAAMSDAVLIPGDPTTISQVQIFIGLVGQAVDDFAELDRDAIAIAAGTPAEFVVPASAVFALVGDGSTESMQLIGKSPAVVDDEVETGSASFDGVDGTIELPNAINATSSYQISFDFKVAVGATSSARFLIDGRDAAGDGVKIEMNGGGSGRVALTQNAAAAVSALNIYNDSNWHSVVCSWDGANISLEIDDQSPVVVAEAVLSVTALARIAARSQFSSPAAFFHGFIKNVSIVLDGVTQNDLPLFPDAKDQSGQGNHGVVVGGVTFVSD